MLWFSFCASHCRCVRLCRISHSESERFKLSNIISTNQIYENELIGPALLQHINCYSNWNRLKQRFSVSLDCRIAFYLFSPFEQIQSTAVKWFLQFTPIKNEKQKKKKWRKATPHHLKKNQFWFGEIILVVLMVVVVMMIRMMMIFPFCFRITFFFLLSCMWWLSFVWSTFMSVDRSEIILLFHFYCDDFAGYATPLRTAISFRIPKRQKIQRWWIKAPTPKCDHNNPFFLPLPNRFYINKTAC